MTALTLKPFLNWNGLLDNSHTAGLKKGGLTCS